MRSRTSRHIARCWSRHVRQARDGRPSCADPPQSTAAHRRHRAPSYFIHSKQCAYQPSSASRAARRRENHRSRGDKRTHTHPMPHVHTSRGRRLRTSTYVLAHWSGAYGGAHATPAPTRRTSHTDTRLPPHVPTPTQSPRQRIAHEPREHAPPHRHTCCRRRCSIATCRARRPPPPTTRQTCRRECPRRQHLSLGAPSSTGSDASSR